MGALLLLCLGGVASAQTARVIPRHASHAPTRVELRADRDTVWIAHRGSEVARYLRSYEPGSWLPAPRLRPEPPPPALAADFVLPEIVPPELADYAALLR